MTFKLRERETHTHTHTDRQTDRDRQTDKEDQKETVKTGFGNTKLRSAVEGRE